MKPSFCDIIENTPVIAAIKDEEGLSKCLESDIEVVFVLYGDICTIADIVKRIKETGKIAMVHVDLISGLSAKDIALDYISDRTAADGIITTRNQLIRHAKELGLYTVLRYFVMDSMALANLEKQASTVQADVIEILPGIMPKIIKRVKSISRVPVIAGGLVADKEDVMTALSNGASAISATKPEIWFL